MIPRTNIKKEDYRFLPFGRARKRNFITLSEFVRREYERNPIFLEEMIGLNECIERGCVRKELTDAFIDAGWDGDGEILVYQPPDWDPRSKDNEPPMFYVESSNSRAWFIAFPRSLDLDSYRFAC
jgi:hypothetical protein